MLPSPRRSSFTAHTTGQSTQIIHVFAAHPSEPAELSQTHGPQIYHLHMGGRDPLRAPFSRFACLVRCSAESFLSDSRFSSVCCAYFIDSDGRPMMSASPSDDSWTSELLLCTISAVYSSSLLSEPLCSSRPSHDACALRALSTRGVRGFRPELLPSSSTCLRRSSSSAAAARAASSLACSVALSNSACASRFPSVAYDTTKPSTLHSRYCCS
mmetsp:Transcript_14687/g.39145  ORF Transcript_14687/g.39145 Transcript_14687/m.39145 type:complete len:213 (-) Transcript_14687:361-999(-)